MLRAALILLAVLAAPVAAHGQGRPILPLAAPERAAIEARVEALLARMTLEEKIGQLNLAGQHDVDPEDIRAGRVGMVMNAIEPRRTNELQRLARSSRLGIPLLFGLDAVQGFRTMFPLPLGQASTWNPRLVELAAEWTSREAAAVGLHWTFAPMVDMSRDPRWGRVIEGAGEDVFFASVIAAARTRGYQRGGMAATPKHFAGYGAVEQGRDYNSTWIPTAQLHDYHFPPFRASLDAGALTVMAAFNALNGLPATAHPGLLRDTLKRDWGFEGFVVSDFNSIGELVHHGVARDDAEAARLALLAGIDVDMVGYVFFHHLANEVRAGRVPEALIDDAVRRVLRVKFRLGIFEQGEISDAAALAQLETPAARAAAREVARESLILLTNRDRVLPLTAATRRIALIGAMATHQDDNPWPGPDGSRPPQPETVLQAMRRLAPAGTVIEHAPAVTDNCGLELGDLPAAVALAGRSDLIVAVLGEDCHEIGEAASRTRLGMPGVQHRVLDALVATGRPVVLVLQTGRPLVLTDVVRQVAALIQTHHPGIEGRTAIAEVLFGAVNPSAKTTFSYPRSVGQIPIYYDRLNTGRPYNPGERWKSRFRDEELTPLFPFGFGLSYTSFAFADARAAAPTVRRAGTVEISVTVTNTGAVAGQEVAQLYVRQPFARRSRPIRQLAGFEKVLLQPGQSRRVTFRLAADQLAWHDDEGRRQLDNGRIELFVGSSSEAPMVGAVEIVD
jgi:beta-glucosidase